MSDLLPCFDDFDSYLSDNWDGEGALPIRWATVELADKIVRSLPPEFHQPNAAPGNGEVCMEWWDKTNTETIWIDVDDDGIVYVYGGMGNFKVNEKFVRLTEEAKKVIGQLFAEAKGML